MTSELRGLTRTPDIDSAAPLLEIDDATVTLDGHPALDHLSLCIQRGEHTAVLGRNGSGKSTLVRVIARELHPLARSGRGPAVRIFGRERWNVAELRQLLGIVSPALQQTFTTDRPPDVLDTVLSGFFAARDTWNHTVTAAMRQRAHEALAQVGASQLLGRSMASLSTGEARRVLIARALAHRPLALLLDEPCAGLDMASRREFIASLGPLARSGTTLLLVTHHVEEIVPEIDRVVLLREGRVLTHGAKSDMLTDTTLSETFGTRVQVQHHGDWYSAAVI